MHTLLKVTQKKLAYVSLFALLIANMGPGALEIAKAEACPYTACAEIRVTRAPVPFDPLAGGTAGTTVMEFETTGPVSALDVAVEVVNPDYAVMSGTSSNLVVRLQEPEHETPGSLTRITWDGKDRFGKIVPPSNQYNMMVSYFPSEAAKLSGYRTIVNSLVTVLDHTIAPPSGGGSGGSGGTGGIGGSNVAALTLNVSPNHINPDGTGTSPIRTTFKVNAQLSQLTIGVYDQFGNPVYQLFSGLGDDNDGIRNNEDNYFEPGDNGTAAPWYGKYQTGDKVPAGVYYIKAFVGGNTSPAAQIQVSVQRDVAGGGGTTTPPAAPVAKITEFTVSPTTIHTYDPENNSLRASFRVNERIEQGIEVRVYNKAGYARGHALFSRRPAEPGYFETERWNATRADGELVERGEYEVRLYVDGEIYARTSVWVETIDPATLRRTAIQSATATPDPFEPETGEELQVQYNLDYELSNVNVRIFKGSFSTNLSVEDATPGAIGTHFAFWDGRDPSGGFAPEGTYTVEVSGNGATSKFDTFRLNLLENAPSAISVCDALPLSFTPSQGGSITISYDVSMPVDGFRVIVVDPRTGRSATLVNEARLEDGDSVAWNGLYGTNTATPGNHEITCTGIGITAVTNTVFVTGTIGDGNTTAFDLKNVYASPNPVQNTVGTTFNFEITHDAWVSLSIYQGNTLVRDLLTQDTFQTGARTKFWDGYNKNGQRATAGTNYTYYLDARSQTSGEYIQKTGTLTVIDSTGGGGGGQSGTFTISGLTAYPNPFNPDFGTTFSMTMSDQARVTLVIYDESNQEVIRLVNNETLSGSPSRFWDGRKTNTERVQPNRTFTYRLEAWRSSDNAFVNLSGSLQSSTSGGGGGSNLIITDFGPSKNRFNPDDGEFTTMQFATNMATTLPTVEIYDDRTNQFIQRLVTREAPYGQISGLSVYQGFRAEWEGDQRDKSGFVKEGTYRYKITATTTTGTSQYDVETGTVYVDRDGTDDDSDDDDDDSDDDDDDDSDDDDDDDDSDDDDDDDDDDSDDDDDQYCAGFIDVPSDHFLCPAIKFVKEKGIFVGDDGGRTLRISEQINRAETAAVIIRALGYELEDYSPSEGKLGYPDLHTDKWYMPLLKTTKKHNIMVGYPDGYMRPEQKMNKAELYKVFVLAALRSPIEDDLVDFSINWDPDRLPYIDVHASHTWYMPFADFAKRYGLVTGVTFKGADKITRGQVIQLFYETHKKDLINYDHLPLE